MIAAVKQPPNRTDSARSEQRSGTRKDAGLRCSVSDGRVVRHTLLADISVGGARIATATPPPLHQPVKVEVTLGAEGAVVQASGYVVWRGEGALGRGGMIGIAFARVENAVALRRYMLQG